MCSDACPLVLVETIRLCLENPPTSLLSSERDSWPVPKRVAFGFDIGVDDSDDTQKSCRCRGSQPDARIP
jgi:hypothetical protein